MDKQKLEVSRHEDNNEIVVRNNRGDILGNFTVDSDVYSEDEQMRWAKLFAAAPELLEALKAYHVALGQFESDYNSPMHQNLIKADQLAEQAIKKATK